VEKVKCVACGQTDKNKFDVEEEVICCAVCSSSGAVSLLLNSRLVWHSEWWGAGVVICLERGADLHMAQLIPLPLTVSCFSKNPDWFCLSGTGSPR